MPRVQRSPPTVPCISLAQTQSEPDLMQVPNEAEPEKGTINVIPRCKRPRSELSPGKLHLATFKYELNMNLNDMFQKWQEAHEKNSFKIIENQNTILTKLVSDVNEIKLQNTQIQNLNQEIEKSMIFINEQYEDLKERISKLEKERSFLIDHNKSLENKLKYIQHSSRCASIVIRNVPMKEKKSSMV
ncbi:unnamed protein product [Euphydryas editha]|uniref:Uncharacterized protein n=1 Tax=Euphydryas editha TaxID=104508 RepID=A0AAU9TLG0_EUPED|nr:unnamed protein product [Euphydryas editha]